MTSGAMSGNLTLGHVDRVSAPVYPGVSVRELRTVWKLLACVSLSGERRWSFLFSFLKAPGVNSHQLDGLSISFQLCWSC